MRKFLSGILIISLMFGTLSCSNQLKSSNEINQQIYDDVLELGKQSLNAIKNSTEFVLIEHKDEQYISRIYQYKMGTDSQGNSLTEKEKELVNAGIDFNIDCNIYITSPNNYKEELLSSAEKFNNLLNIKFDIETILNN